jgi:hypothetical protein
MIPDALVTSWKSGPLMLATTEDVKHTLRGRQVQAACVIRQRPCIRAHDIDAVDENCRRRVMPDFFDNRDIHAQGVEALSDDLPSRLSVGAARSSAEFDTHDKFLPAMPCASPRDPGATRVSFLSDDEQSSSLASRSRLALSADRGGAARAASSLCTPNT